jgi:hypothetical protein
LTGKFSDRYETKSGIKTIQFNKGKSLNQYIVTFYDGRSEVTYPKIGMGTPSELKALGFSVLETEREEEFCLNIQAQHDPLFLVTATETTLTGVLNTLFGIAPYERALRSINSDTIKTNQQFDAKSRELICLESTIQDKSSEALRTSSWLSKLETLRGQIEHVDFDLARIVDGIEGFSRLLVIFGEVGINAQGRIAITSSVIYIEGLQHLLILTGQAADLVVDLKSAEIAIHESVVTELETKIKIFRLTVILPLISMILSISQGVEALIEGERHWNDIRFDIATRGDPLSLEGLMEDLSFLHNIRRGIENLYIEKEGCVNILEGQALILVDQNTIAGYMKVLLKETHRCPTCHQLLVGEHDHA